MAALPLTVELRTLPVYQRIAAEAAAMQDAGALVAAIAQHFGVDYSTVIKAVRWFRRRGDDADG